MNYFDGISFPMCGIAENCRYTTRNNPSYFGLQYIQDGRVHLKIDNGRRQLMNGPCAFITYPGHCFEYGSPKGHIRTHYWLCFFGARVDSFIDGGLLPVKTDSPFIKINYAAQFSRAMHELIVMINANRTRHEKMVMLLENLLFQLHDQGNQNLNISSHLESSFRQLQEDIRTNPTAEWLFDKEAVDLNISRNYFNRLFRLYSHFSPQQFVISCRMKLAIELLLNSNEQVKAIAIATGFDNEFYFSRLFKKKYGLAPLKYRQEFTGKILQ